MDWSKVFLGVDREFFSSGFAKIGIGLGVLVFFLGLVRGSRGQTIGELLLISALPFIVSAVVYSVRRGD